MNKDIEYIIKRLEYVEPYRNCTTSINGIEIKTLLDYITNLQEKVNQYENPDDLTLFYMWLDVKAKDKMKQLQEENEYSDYCNEQLRKKIANLEYKIKKAEEDNKQLKELCDKYEEEHNTTFQEWLKELKENK